MVVIFFCANPTRQEACYGFYALLLNHKIWAIDLVRVRIVLMARLLCKCVYFQLEAYSNKISVSTVFIVIILGTFPSVSYELDKTLFYGCFSQKFPNINNKSSHHIVQLKKILSPWFVFAHSLSFVWAFFLSFFHDFLLLWYEFNSATHTYIHWFAPSKCILKPREKEWERDISIPEYLVHQSVYKPTIHCPLFGRMKSSHTADVSKEFNLKFVCLIKNRTMIT